MRASRRTLPAFALLLAALVAALLAALLPQTASAQVRLSFHSFTGSITHGRYPHAFIVLEGTLDGSHRRVRANYGYTPVTVSAAIFQGNVPARIHVEKRKHLAQTNRHFTVPISDAQYRAIEAEVQHWRDGPGMARYNLNTNNCVHFVARIAALAGLKVDFPQGLALRPKAWLNHITAINPQLGAREVP